MKVPFSWLKEYVDIDISPEELQEKLFSCGFEVEELINLHAGIDRVVVGVVTEAVKQEGTHLTICKLDCGEYGKNIQISTGADNIYVGAHVPAALDNATLPGGITIKSKKMRGVESVSYTHLDEIRSVRCCFYHARYVENHVSHL